MTLGLNTHSLSSCFNSQNSFFKKKTFLLFLQCHIKGYTTCVCLSPFQHLHCLFKTCFKQNKLKIGQSDILKPNANDSNGSHQTPDPMCTRGL